MFMDDIHVGLELNVTPVEESDLITGVYQEAVVEMERTHSSKLLFLLSVGYLLVVCAVCVLLWTIGLTFFDFFWVAFK